MKVYEILQGMLDFWNSLVLTYNPDAEALFLRPEDNPKLRDVIESGTLLTFMMITLGLATATELEAYRQEIHAATTDLAIEHFAKRNKYAYNDTPFQNFQMVYESLLKAQWYSTSSNMRLMLVLMNDAISDRGITMDTFNRYVEWIYADEWHLRWRFRQIGDNIKYSILWFDEKDIRLRAQNLSRLQQTETIPLSYTAREEGRPETRTRPGKSAVYRPALPEDVVTVIGSFLSGTSGTLKQQMSQLKKLSEEIEKQRNAAH